MAKVYQQVLLSIIPILITCFLFNSCITKEKLVSVKPEPDNKISEQYVDFAQQMEKNGHYQTSIHFYQKAIDKYEKLEIWNEAIKCYIKMGDNYYKLGNTTNALNILNQALGVSKNKLGFQNLELSKSFQKLAFDFLKKKNYDKALELYQKALAIQLEVLGKDHPDVAKTQNSISLIYWNKNDPIKASKYFNLSYSNKLRQFQEVPKDTKKKFLHMDKKVSKKGKFNKARKYFNNTLQEYRKRYGENKPLFASLYDQIGILYAFEGDIEKALEYIRKAFNIRLELYGDFSPEIATGYLNIGICLRLKEEYAEALETLNNALKIKIHHFSEFHPEMTDIYFQLGKVYYHQLKLNKAIEHFQRALISLVPGFSDIHINANPDIEGVYPKDKLLEILSAKANTLKLNYLYHPDQIETLNMAFDTYLDLSNLIERMRGSYKSESYKLYFGEKNYSIFREAIQTALLLYDVTRQPEYIEAAFIFSEKSKANVLTEALYEAKAKNFAGIPDNLLKKEKDLRGQLTFYDTYLEKEYHREKPDQKKIDKLKEFYHKLVLDYTHLINLFEKNYKKYYQLKYQPHEINLTEIQKSIGPDTALVEYFIGNEVLYIFVLTHDDIDVKLLPLDEDINRMVNNFNRAIKKIEELSFLLTGSKLYQVLIKPIRDMLEEKKKIIIIPDGILYTLPFESLITGTSPSNELSERDFLIKHYAFTYHYSANLWKQSLNQKNIEAKNAFVGFAPVFGDQEQQGYIIAHEPKNSPDRRYIVKEQTAHLSQLPASEYELQEIIQLFKDHQKEAIGFFHQKANEKNFKSPEIKNYNYIHIATHSLDDDGKYKLSGLVFSVPSDESQSKEDGILYAGEIYNLDLNAELIVLSSCESGVGELVKGEGMMALNRGFFYSGIKNIVFSLWKVEDRCTRKLMVAFYKNILKGHEYSKSLRLAKLKLIENPLTAFPLYWSGFILVGK